MGSVILITGATGFLGSRIARRLLCETDAEVIALVRAENPEEARRRLYRSWRETGESAGGFDSRLRALPADLTRENLGLDRETWRELSRQITHVVHSAADLRLEGPLEELRRTNVGGTANLLALAREAQRHHGLVRFSHISTAYVAGGRTGEVAESELTDAYGFSNSYEQSKYEGERLVREAMEELPVTVFRPGMVVGDSETGEISCFNTVYVPLKLYLCGKLPVVPSRPDLRVNMVPVDYVADAVFRLTFDARAEGRTFHLTVDPDRLPTARMLLETVSAWARRRLLLDLPRLRFIPLERLARFTAGRIPGVPRFLLRYFNEDRRFLREETDRLARAVYTRLGSDPAPSVRLCSREGFPPPDRTHGPRAGSVQAAERTASGHAPRCTGRAGRTDETAERLPSRSPMRSGHSPLSESAGATGWGWSGTTRAGTSSSIPR